MNKDIPEANGKEPDAPAPAEMRDALAKIIFTHYIGQSPSRSKAEKCADKIIEHLTTAYEAALEQENNG